MVSPPGGHPGGVFFFRQDGTRFVVCLGTADGKIVWERKFPSHTFPMNRDNGLLYLVGDNGLIRCLRTRTGEPVWQHKLEDEFYGSPVYNEDRLYLTSKAGTVYVIAAGDQFKLLARNSLGESSFATPAIAGGSIFFRTLSHLIAVAEVGAVGFAVDNRTSWNRPILRNRSSRRATARSRLLAAGGSRYSGSRLAYPRGHVVSRSRAGPDNM